MSEPTLYRFAQVNLGKVIYIYETYNGREELEKIFYPGQPWFDVTGQDCEIGYYIQFDPLLKTCIFKKPEIIEPTSLEDWQKVQVQNLHNTFIEKGREPINFKNTKFDFDEISAERLNWAINAKQDIIWTDFYNQQVSLSSEELTQLGITIKNVGDRLHSIYLFGKNMINSSTDIEEIKKMDWKYIEERYPKE